MLKRISAVGVSCVTALVLMLSSFAVPANVSAVSLEEMANVAIDCIMSHEGSYGSINPNDCGAVSVGKLQWHADRALTVMRRACQINPSFAAATLGSYFYNEVMSASSWSYRTFSSSEASAASTLLASECGIAAQDAQANEDVQGYIVTAQNMGITNAGALVLYADIYNFGCGIAARVAKRAASYAGSYSAVTLENMYQAALNDNFSSTSAFVSRANMVYSYLCGIGYGNGSVSADDTTTTTTPAVQFTEDGAGTYTVTASLLNMRSGAGTGYSIVTTIPNGTIITVTATGGDWAAVVYESFEGYCCMTYLAPYEEASISETTTTEAVTTTVTETTTESETTETTTIASETEAETTEITTTETDVTEETTETTTVTGETETTESSETTTATTVSENVIVNSAYASVYGDVNCDGAVTVADAVLLHKYLVGAVSFNMEQLANADCSLDSVLTTKDVTVIMQHLSGYLTALPIL